MSGLSLAVKRMALRASPGLAWRMAGYLDPDDGFNLRLARALSDPHRLGLDIGGSWGLFAAAIIARVRELHVFEPNPEKAAYLSSALRGAVVHGIALSDEAGEVELFIPDLSSAMATIEAANPARQLPGQRALVRRERLDSLDLGPVGFIKMDVEGHEAAVLQGAEALLRRDMPAILVELEDRHRPDAVRLTSEWLRALGYRGYMLDKGVIRDIAQFDAARDQSAAGLAAGGRGRYLNSFLFLGPDDDGALRARLAAAGVPLPHG